MNQHPTIAVIGGGISGLAAAYQITRLNPQAKVHLFEASERLGGVIRTERLPGLVVEHGPDMFTTKEPDALELCRELGIENELVPTNQENRGAMISKQGKLHPVPTGMSLLAPHRVGPIVKTPLLTPLGKLRLLSEYFVSRRDQDSDESLESFAVRRFGRNAFEWLVQPLISGIYTADPAQLSMKATLAEFLELEKKDRSILRGVLKRKRLAKKKASNDSQEDEKASGARYGLFLAPKTGMQRLIERLAEELPTEAIQLHTPIRSIKPKDAQGWQIETKEQTFEADGLIVALPAIHAADLLESMEPELSQQLQTVEYASSAVPVFVVNRRDISKPINCFGIVVPIADGREILATSFSSMKFPGRAPEGQLIIRVFIGGACQAQLLEKSDEQLIALARRELADLIGLSPDAKPLVERVVRWNRAMPQYTLGHLDRVTKIELLAERLPQFELAGNAYHGVGIPYCIRSGRQAAARLMESLNATQSVSNPE